MPSYLKISATLTARPGKAETLATLLHNLIAPTRAEPGNLRYDLWQDQENPSRFVLDELYKDRDAIAAHRASTYFQDYLSKINSLAERTAMVLVPIDVV